MKKIKIIIPDDLTPLEEAAEIAKKLTQKTLSGHGRQADKIRIGNQVDIKEKTTQITIERIGEKPIEMVMCNACGCEYQSDLHKKVFINYGGKIRTIKVCSDKCAEDVVNFLGDRAAHKKSKLKPLKFY